MELADNVILVGDPGRVAMVSEFLTDIEFRHESREFVSTTGRYNGKTGVDIAFNNCTFIRNYINEGVSLSSNYQNTWFNLNPFTGSVVFSNCTIWGRTYQGISKEG